MRTSLTLAFACFVWANSPSEVRGVAFNIEAWNLNIGIVHEFPDIVGTSFNDVQNPFIDSHAVTLGLSSAAASYDFAWDVTFGRFLIEASLAAEGVDSSVLTSAAPSRITIRPEQDLVVRILGEYSYDLPVVGMQTVFEYGVAGVDVPGILISESLAFNSALGGGVGTLVIDEEFVMPAVQAWEIVTRMEISTSSGSAGSIGTGSGFFDIQINPVPEPSTLWLLTIGILVTQRRNRRRFSSTT